MARDTAHTTQQTTRAHRGTGAKWPRTPHMQSNAPSAHIGEREPGGPGRRTRNTTHRAGTRANMSQVAQDTAHTSTRRAAEGQERTNTAWVGRTGATQPTHGASCRGVTSRPPVRAQAGCIGGHGKRRPEQWEQPVTGESLHSPGGGCLPSSEAPQLKPQGSGGGTIDEWEQYPLW